MKTVWLVGEFMFLCLAIIFAILRKADAVNQYLIMSFEMAIMYQLESKS